MKNAVGYLLTGTALIACPCHLVVLLPAALSLLGGTALGAVLAAYDGWLIAAATIYFIVALGSGLYLLNRRAEKGANCRRPRPDGGREHPRSLEARQATGRANG